MNLTQHNPYRTLGVFANSPTKERVANQTKMKAFLKVGKPVAFPLDLPQYLSSLSRDVESVAAAESQLALPAEQVRYAQFWFLKITPLDEMAFKYLTAGNMDEAIGLWEKRENVSSLQNRLVCALLKSQYASAISLAQTLYAGYEEEFAEAVVGSGSSVQAEGLDLAFLDALAAEVGAQTLLPFVRTASWKQHLSASSVKPIIEALEQAVETAKSSRGSRADLRYQAGEALMKETKKFLPQLRQLLSTDDLQYMMIADKVGLAILQCGIDYFNGSEAPEASQEAMVLQKFAQQIVVGDMAKGRCKENVDILAKIIEKLPPAEVFAEDKAIQEELRKFCNLPDKIEHSVTLLNQTKPHLQSIKQKLGASNAYYLKISTTVVQNALHNVIEEVNNKLELAKNDPKDYIFVLISITLRSAWQATQTMDTFDIESSYKPNYVKNRETLKDLCLQVGIETRKAPHQPLYSPRPKPSKSSVKDKELNPFLVILLIHSIWGGLVFLEVLRAF